MILVKNCEYLQKIVSFRSCCTSRNFLKQAEAELCQAQLSLELVQGYSLTTRLRKVTDSTREQLHKYDCSLISEFHVGVDKLMMGPGSPYCPKLHEKLP